MRHSDQLRTRIADYLASHIPEPQPAKKAAAKKAPAKKAAAKKAPAKKAVAR